MGILNVTPDSFSDGGRFTSEETVARQVETMLSHGVDIIDVGGESTRPFAEPVPEDEELARILPAIRTIRRISDDIPVSIDTTKAAVARAALAEGATMVNDISALRHDPEMTEVVRNYEGPVIIMHMQGTPRSMQLDPRYGDVVEDILQFFRERLDVLEQNGIGRDRVVIDPGIGFGKTVEHNLDILRNLRRFRTLGRPLLVGHSRKSFLGKLFDLEVDQRDCATAVLSGWCSMEQVDILRVHDVRMTVIALRLLDLMAGSGPDAAD